MTLENVTTMDPAPVTTASEMPQPVKVILSILIAVAMLGSIFGNSIVCLIVYQKPAMRSAINLLLANMALANILLAAICMPFALATLIVGSWVFGVVLCRIIAFCHRLFICEAVFVLFTISIDRFLIIVQRRDKLTPIRAKFVIMATWCMSIVLTFPPTLGWGLYTHYPGWMQCILMESSSALSITYLAVSMTIIFYAPMCILMYTYLCILNVVRKRANRIDTHSCLSQIPIGSVTRLGLSVIAYPEMRGIDMSFKTRAFKTILLLFLVYFICWLPYSVAIMRWNLSRTLTCNALAGNLLLFLGYLNTTINPVIYCWKIAKFREACQELFPRTARILPRLPDRTKRWMDPSGPYKLRERPITI